MKNLIIYNDNGEIIPATAKFSNEAKKEWIRIFNEITEKQNSDDENEYLKSMLPKQKSYIPRFALILNLLEAFQNDSKYYEVSAESVLKAEKLSKYFIAMAKKIKINSTEMNKINKIVKNGENKSDFDIFKDVYKKDPEVNITQLSERMNLSRSTLMRYKKKINEEK